MQAGQSHRGASARRRVASRPDGTDHDPWLTPSANAASAQGAGNGILFRAEGLAEELWRRAGRARHFAEAFPPASCLPLSGRMALANRRLLNLMSGLYQPDAGTMTFAGIDLVGMAAHRRVRHGLARTFQKIRLFKQLSVLENVIAGISHPPRHPGVAIYRARRRLPPRPHALPRRGDGPCLTFVGLSGRVAGDRRLAVLWRAAHARNRSRARNGAAPADGRRTGGRVERGRRSMRC